MSHFKEMPYFSGLHLLTVNNKVAVPQDIFTFHTVVGVDKDGESVVMFNMKTELEGKYFVLIFLPMDLTFDSEEVLSFKASLESFAAEGCQVIGITADSPLAITRWIRKSVSDGGFGGAPGFPILSDRDLSFSASCGVARECGSPARATLIVDWSGNLRYMAAHRTDIPRNVTEILRLVQAFRHSDLTGHALPSDWAPGGEVVPTDFTHKVAYFLKKYGERPENAKEGEAVDNNMKDGQMVKEEEKEVEEKVEEADKEEDEMVEKMIGDYGPQQKVFRKMRSNPPSTA